MHDMFALLFCFVDNEEYSRLAFRVLFANIAVVKIVYKHIASYMLSL